MSNFVESPEKFAGFIFSVELRVSPLGCVYVCVCKYCTCVHLLSCHISTIRHGSTHTRRTFQKRFIGTYTVWKMTEFYSQPFLTKIPWKLNLEEKSWCGLISRNIWEWMRILSFSTTLRIPHSVWKFDYFSIRHISYVKLPCDELWTEKWQKSLFRQFQMTEVWFFRIFANFAELTYRLWKC